MLGNGNGNGSARPPNSRRPGQSNNVQAQVAANHHHQQHIQEHNQHQHQLNHHNQHHQNIYVHPAGGSQGHSAVRSNMDPPSTATGAGARNRQHQNHHPAQGSHHPSGARYPPPVAAAASNEHDLANPQNEQHHGGFHSAAVDTESYPSHSQGNSQVLDRHDTITPPKVGTLICVKGGKKSVIDLTPREYTIGRSVDCDVVLTSLECSKRHCRIFVLAEPSQQPQVDGAPTCVWMIQDLSTNGTFVNGKRIPKNQPLPLYSGDLLEIKVGNYFEFSSLHAMYPDPNEELKDPEYSVIHDKYLLTRKLGSGTYASVYLTQELATGRRYACKVVNKRKAGLSERQTSNKLVQEIEVIRHFNHPNIIRVHNCIETRLYLYVVMDLAQSGELFDYLAAQYGIEETKCKLIMYQIFKGLKYLHENKVVHRDIKPENILLDFSGEFPRVMLADFGLAKRRNTEGPERMTTLCGTLNYLAPEVINPPVRAQGYDDVVDCWAAGIMLFFLLTCRHPFDDENDTKLKKKILRDELKLYAPASDGGNLFDHLSPEVADLIHQLLARNPAERLSAAAALKHPWFMSSITELKTAYKAVHQSWEAQAQSRAAVSLDDGRAHFGRRIIFAVTSSCVAVVAGTSRG